MIQNFYCPCGNKDPKKAHHYDGALGYEAFICKCCGIYFDYEGQHEADVWSKNFIVDYDDKA